MKILASLLIINVLCINADAQEMSVGVRGGGGVRLITGYYNGSQAKTGYLIPEKEIFIRYNLPKGFVIEASGSNYRLEQKNEWPLGFRDLTSTSRYKCKNTEIRLSAQYNYLNLSKKKLQLYIGHSFSRTQCEFTEEYTNQNFSHGPLDPYYFNKSNLWYSTIGLNHTLIYNIHKNISLQALISSQKNISAYAVPAYYFGDIRISGLLGVSYKFSTLN